MLEHIQISACWYHSPVACLGWRRLIERLQGSETGDISLIVRAFGLMCAWLPFFFMLNDSGESVMHNIGAINQSIFQQSWYLYPVELQRYLIPIQITAQRPAYLEGFAHINFSRETFSRVMCDCSMFEVLILHGKIPIDLIEKVFSHVCTGHQLGLLVLYDTSPFQLKCVATRDIWFIYGCTSHYPDNWIALSAVEF